MAQCAIHPGRSIVQRACGNGPVSKRAASVGGLSVGMQKLADLQIFRTLFALVGDHVISDLVAFAEVIQAGLFNRRDVDEHVLSTAAVRLDEAITLCGIEPLHCTCRHDRTLLILPHASILGRLRGAPQERTRRDVTSG